VTVAHQLARGTDARSKSQTKNDVIQTQLDEDREQAEEANSERADIAREMFEGDFGDEAISEAAGETAGDESE